MTNKKPIPKNKLNFGPQNPEVNKTLIPIVEDGKDEILSKRLDFPVVSFSINMPKLFKIIYYSSDGSNLLYETFLSLNKFLESKRKKNPYAGITYVLLKSEFERLMLNVNEVLTSAETVRKQVKNKSSLTIYWTKPKISKDDKKQRKVQITDPYILDFIHLIIAFDKSENRAFCFERLGLKEGKAIIDTQKMLLDEFSTLLENISILSGAFAKFDIFPLSMDQVKNDKTLNEKLISFENEINLRQLRVVTNHDDS